MAESVEMWECDVCKKKHDEEGLAEECCWGTIKIIGVTDRCVEVTRETNQISVCMKYQLHMTMRDDELIVVANEREDDLDVIDILLSPDWFKDEVLGHDNKYAFEEILADRVDEWSRSLGGFVITTKLDEGHNGDITSYVARVT